MSGRWVRNLRAAGEGELRHRGRSEGFRAIEITGDARCRVVEAYRAKLGRAVNALFAQIPEPACHPVFRIEPIT